MKKKQDELLRYLWGSLTLTAEDIARALDKFDGETRETLQRLFEITADAQQKAESIYLEHAKERDLPVGDSDTVYIAIPKELEQEIRNTVAVLASSSEAENELEAASDELKMYLRVVGRGLPFGAGEYLVGKRLKIRGKQLETIAKSVKSKRRMDNIPAADLEAIRAEVRQEIETKMLNTADRLQELRDMIRAKRAELD